MWFWLILFGSLVLLGLALALFQVRFRANLHYVQTPFLFTAEVAAFGGHLRYRFRISEQGLKSLYQRLAGTSKHDPLTGGHLDAIRDRILELKERFDEKAQNMPLAGKAFLPVRKHLYVERLRVSAVIGNRDPALAGHLIGFCWAVSGFLLWAARKGKRFAQGEPRFRITPAFNRPSAEVRVEFAFRAPLRLLLESSLRYAITVRSRKKPIERARAVLDGSR